MRSFYAAGAPPTVRVAAVVQALEAVALCAAAVAQLVEAASGRSYQASSAVGLAVMELIVVALIAGIASGIARVRPWSRTPAVMTQLGCGLVGIILLQAHRAAWGLPPLILAVAGLAALFSPASLKALSRR
jgi:cytochrome b